MYVSKESGKTIYDANVTGTPANDSWDRYQKFMLDIAKQRNLLGKEIGSSNVRIALNE